MRGGKYADKRGNIVLFTLILFLILGFAALSIDVGHMMVVETELQVVSDAAAVAAVSKLTHSPDDPITDATAARELAVYLASLNFIEGDSVSLDLNPSNDPDGDIVLGYWDTTTDTFDSFVDYDEFNSVKVRARRNDMGMTFALAAWGIRGIDVTATAIATVGEPVGAGKVECFMPIALPDCIFDGRSEEALDLADMRLQPSTGDNFGWGNPFGAASSSSARSQLSDTCSGDSVTVGDPVSLNNGVMTDAMKDVVDMLVISSTSWNSSLWGAQPPRLMGSDVPASKYGQTLEGVIILFSAGPEYCNSIVGDEDWNPSSRAMVSGFAWGAIYDVKYNTKSKGDRTMKMRLELLNDREIGTGSGGPDRGIVSRGNNLLVY
jgi:hypothetical protein